MSPPLGKCDVPIPSFPMLLSSFLHLSLCSGSGSQQNFHSENLSLLPQLRIELCLHLVFANKKKCPPIFPNLPPFPKYFGKQNFLLHLDSFVNCFLLHFFLSKSRLTTNVRRRNEILWKEKIRRSAQGAKYVKTLFTKKEGKKVAVP